MRPKNIPVGPLSAVSPETLRSVYRVLMYYLDGRHFDRSEGPLPAWLAPHLSVSWEDEQTARDFAQALRSAAKAEEREG